MYKKAHTHTRTTYTCSFQKRLFFLLLLIYQAKPVIKLNDDDDENETICYCF